MSVILGATGALVWARWHVLSPNAEPQLDGKAGQTATQPAHERVGKLSAGTDTLAGPPTIDVTTINAVLASYDSPMAGKGQEIYDLGVQYGIDPAFCLAFFVHESAAGTRGEAVLTHSVGNIRAEPDAPSLDGYRLYDTWEQSVRDWYRLIGDVYIGQWHLRTVDQIVPVYAPADDDNDVSAYIRDVEALVSDWRAQVGHPPGTSAAAARPPPPCS